MESYTVSARKYRPADFASVVGQEHVTHTLKNAIKSNHLAQAFLFCGPRGIGKTTCARILAKTINCTSRTEEGEACNSCESCKTFISKQSFNFYELDAASNNSVEDIRKLVEQVRFAPQSGKYKVYIIDEVHMLSQSAFNAFLKTLEEPPSYAIFILATTERHKIIPTILSRCQIFDFKRIQVRDIAQHLAYVCEKENVTAEEDALFMIAQKADGALRDSLSILDRIISFSGDNITYKDVVENLNILDYDYYLKITEHLLTQNYSEAVLLLDDIINKGFDLQNFLSGLCKHLRDLLFCKTPNTLHLLEVPETIQKLYMEQTAKTANDFLLSALNVLSGFEAKYKSSKNQRLHTELALLKLCYINEAISLAQKVSSDYNTQFDKKKTVSAKVEEFKPGTGAGTREGSGAGAGEVNKAGAGAGEVNKAGAGEGAGAGTIAGAGSGTGTSTGTGERTGKGAGTGERTEEGTGTGAGTKTGTLESSGSQSLAYKSPPSSNKSVSESAAPSVMMNLENIKKIVNTTSDSDKTESNDEEKQMDSKLPVPDSKSMENAWENCKTNFENQAGSTLITILKAGKPKLISEGILEIEVENKVQKETFEQEKSKLHEFMSSQLNNNNFELKCKYDPSNSKKPRPQMLSGKAIFEKMKEENPDLEILKIRFDLNVDN